MIAATAAATGVIGATVAVSITPWTHEALGSASHSAQADASITTARPAGAAATGGMQLDSLRSAATGGSTAVLPSVGKPVQAQPAQHKPVTAVAAAATAKAVANPAVDVKAQAAAKAKAAAAAKARAAAAARAKAAAAAARAKAAAAAARAKAAAAAKAKPYLIYDSVTPSALPTDKAAAVYSNGAYAASAAQMAHQKPNVLWIDTNGSNPNANVLDVEPGDATPAGAAAWVQQRLSAHPHDVAIVYTMMSAWGDVKSHVGHLPSWMQHKVRYWIADPTGNPHVVPGSNATQWYWGKSIDITTAHPSLTR
jgi:hypothetical protein